MCRWCSKRDCKDFHNHDFDDIDGFTRKYSVFAKKHISKYADFSSKDL